MGKKGRQGKPAAALPPQATPKSATAPSTPAGSAPAAAVADITPDAGQPPPNRALANAFIGLFVLFQLAMPLRYYLLGGGTDERFSWRMFSSIRMQTCEVKVHDIIAANGQRNLRKVELRKVLHGAWVNMLERYRPRAVDMLLQRRCDESGVTAARYLRDCKDTDGERRPTLEVEMDCARKQSRIVRGAP
jgi:hypothetical protein